ncbi:MAG: ureidoglycolate lyase [Myxococcota bacterium]
MTDYRPLEIVPLTREAFRPFGEVIETHGRASYPINGGTTDRFHDLAPVDVQTGGGRALINIFRARPVLEPPIIRMLERHPLGSQAFVPLSRRPYLVVVAEPGSPLDPETMRAFLAGPSQGVSYARGTWHHPLLALEAESEFLVVDRGGPGDNCDEVELAESAIRQLVAG